MATGENIGGTPYLAVGNDEIGGVLREQAKCPHCSLMHEVEYGERVLDDGTRVPSKMLAYVKCGNGDVYIVGVNRRSIV